MTRSYLGDDGTMDTVIVCGDCGREHRFNFDSDADEDRSNGPDRAAYDDFVDECCETVDDDCECHD